MGSKSTAIAADINEVIQDNLNKTIASRRLDRAIPVAQIVNSYASKENTERISKMHSQKTAQSYESANQNSLVFTRQIYNPELIFNQDTNREDVKIDLQSPFNWHVNFKTDGCYICE